MSRRGRLRPWATRAQLRGYPTSAPVRTRRHAPPGSSPVCTPPRASETRQMARFTIYYARRPTYLDSGLFGTPLLTVSRLPESHVRVCEIEAGSRGDVWLAMQAENWSPHGEARPLLEKLGLTHTSLSVGDVIRDEESIYWECVESGWRQIEDDTEGSNAHGRQPDP